MSINRPAVITNLTAHAVAERPTAAVVAARPRNDMARRDKRSMCHPRQR
jgi:hypothetical protein